MRTRAQRGAELKVAKQAQAELPRAVTMRLRKVDREEGMYALFSLTKVGVGDVSSTPESIRSAPQEELLIMLTTSGKAEVRSLIKQLTGLEPLPSPEPEALRPIFDE